LGGQPGLVFFQYAFQGGVQVNVQAFGQANQ
jgi:hypothetical protein